MWEIKYGVTGYVSRQGKYSQAGEVQPADVQPAGEVQPAWEVQPGSGRDTKDSSQAADGMGHENRNNYSKI